MCSATVSPSQRCLSHKDSSHAHNYVLQLICWSSFYTILSGVSRGMLRVLQHTPVHLIYSSKRRKQITTYYVIVVQTTIGAGHRPYCACTSYNNPSPWTHILETLLHDLCLNDVMGTCTQCTLVVIVKMYEGWTGLYLLPISGISTPGPVVQSVAEQCQVQ